MRLQHAIAAATAAVGALAIAVLAPVQAAAVPQQVVFMHGYLGNAGTMGTAMQAFRQAGYSSAQLHNYVYDYHQDLLTTANGLQAFVAQVQKDTGAQKVSIVNYSMGGLVTQWYVTQMGGTANVDKVASLGGANHGTNFGDVCALLDASCKDMLPSSDMVKTINATNDTPGPTTYATWYSTVDTVILPYQLTLMTNAVNTSVPGEAHTNFPKDPQVLNQVVKFVRG